MGNRDTSEIVQSGGKVFGARGSKKGLSLINWFTICALMFIKDTKVFFVSPTGM